MAGRPKSNAVKRLTGSRHYNEEAPHPSRPDDLRVPRGLLSRQGRKFWHDNLPELVDLGVVTSADLPAFALLCQAWSFAHDAADVLRDEGMVVDGAKQNTKKHPAFQQWRDSVNLFLKIGGSFGMLPDMRSRLDALPGGGEADTEVFIENLRAVVRQGRNGGDDE